MANDIIGKVTNIAELALVAGICYLGYKAYKEFFPDKKDKNGNDKQASTQDTPIKAATDLLGWRGSTDDMLKDDLSRPLSATIAVNAGILGTEIMADPVKRQPVIALDNTLKQTNPLYKTLAQLYGLVFPTPFSNFNPEVEKRKELAASTVGGNTTGWTKGSGNIRLKDNPVIPAAGNAATDAAKTTVVYNNSIGERLTLDQVLPADRVTLDKTPEQQIAAYGALEYKPVPVTLPEPVRQTNNDIYVWVDTVSRSLSTEPIAGRTKMSLQEALSRGY